MTARAWRRFVCRIIDHEWRVLRIAPGSLRYQEAGAYVGCDVRCDRCGEIRRDYDDYLDREITRIGRMHPIVGVLQVPPDQLHTMTERQKIGLLLDMERAITLLEGNK